VVAMNITLIGMPAVGKSFVGKILAEKLGYSFIDVDLLIEKITGMKLQEFINKFGDDKFLEIEEKVALDLNREKLDNCVISPGGSIVYCRKAMDFLRKISVVVFLDSSFENIQNRLNKKSNTRGIIGMKNKTLEHLYEERTILYKKYCDAQIKVSDKTKVNEIIKEIIKNLKNK